jgi:hypothetical protein
MLASATPRGSRAVQNNARLARMSEGEYTPITAYGDVIPRSEFPLFLDDLARLQEGVVTKAYVLDRWSICPSLDWPELERNKRLQHLVRMRVQERLLNGAAGREKARAKYPSAVEMVSKIVEDRMTPPKVKTDAARELRQMAGFLDASELPPQGGAFRLEIHIGDGRPKIIEHVSKPTQFEEPFDMIVDDEDQLNRLENITTRRGRAVGR